MKKVKAWYHPRGREASQMLFSVRHALKEPLYFVAGTGAGKTTYLQSDLIPLAAGAKDGCLPIYVALGTDRDNPLDVLINAINRQIDDLKKQPWGRVVSAATTPVESIEFAGAGIKFGQSAPPVTPKSSGLIQLDRAIEELKRLAKKQVLLVIDDAHLLLRAPDVGSLGSCLRAAISSDPGRINAVFALDSDIAAESLFQRRGAPFWKFGRQAKFPPAGEDFVQNMCSLYEIETEIKLDQAQMKTAFNELFRQPRAFMTLIGQMAADQAVSPDAYLMDLRVEVMQEDDWSDLHNNLSPLQQAILRRIVNREAPDTPEALASYAADTKKSFIAPETVVRESKPLLEMRVILKDGEWKIANEEYRNWMLNRQPALSFQSQRGEPERIAPVRYFPTMG